MVDWSENILTLYLTYWIVPYCGGLLRKATWHFDCVLEDHVTNENHLSPLLKSQLPLNLAGIKLGWMLTYLNGHLPIKSLEPMITWQHQVTDKTIILHYHIGYGHETWQDDDLLVRPSPIKLFDLFVMRSCKITWHPTIIISPLTKSLKPLNLKRMVRYLKGLLP